MHALMMMWKMSSPSSSPPLDHQASQKLPKSPKLLVLTKFTSCDVAFRLGSTGVRTTNKHGETNFVTKSRLYPVSPKLSWYLPRSRRSCLSKMGAIVTRPPTSKTSIVTAQLHPEVLQAVEAVAVSEKYRLDSGNKIKRQISTSPLALSNKILASASAHACAPGVSCGVLECMPFVRFPS